MSHQFNGTWPALVTPLDSNGKVNTSVLKDLLDYLLDKKIGGFIFAGQQDREYFYQFRNVNEYWKL